MCVRGDRNLKRRALVDFQTPALLPFLHSHTRALTSEHAEKGAERLAGANGGIRTRALGAWITRTFAKDPDPHLRPTLKLLICQGANGWLGG